MWKGLHSLEMCACMTVRGKAFITMRQCDVVIHGCKCIYAEYVKIVRSRSGGKSMLACVVECLDLEHFFLVCWYIFRISRSGWCIKVIGSRSKSQEQKSISVFFLQIESLLFSAVVCCVAVRSWKRFVSLSWKWSSCSVSSGQWKASSMSSVTIVVGTMIDS